MNTPDGFSVALISGSTRTSPPPPSPPRARAGAVTAPQPARAANIRTAEERLRGLRAISDQVAPGRWDEVREPNSKELRATSVLRLPLEEASAKVRSGPPIDDPEDLAHPSWAGVLPLSLQPGPPVPSPDLAPGVPVPEALSRYGRGRQGA